MTDRPWGFDAWERSGALAVKGHPVEGGYAAGSGFRVAGSDRIGTARHVVDPYYKSSMPDVSFWSTGERNPTGFLLAPRGARKDPPGLGLFRATDPGFHLISGYHKQRVPLRYKRRTEGSDLLGLLPRDEYYGRAVSGMSGSPIVDRHGFVHGVGARVPFGSDQVYSPTTPQIRHAFREGPFFEAPDYGMDL